jgi:hypothetical protein
MEPGGKRFGGFVLVSSGLTAREVESNFGRPVGHKASVIEKLNRRLTVHQSELA